MTFFEEFALWIGLVAFMAILAPTPLALKKRRIPLPAAPTPAFEYASFGRRLVAVLIDGTILSIVYVPLGYVMFPTIFTVIPTSSGEIAPFLQSYFAYLGLDVLVSLMYYGIMEGRTGATIGKMALKVRVVSEDGGLCGLGSAYLRNLLRFVDMAPYIIPYLLGVIKIRRSPKKQRLGDSVAKMIVVKKGVPALAVQPPPPT